MVEKRDNQISSRIPSLDDLLKLCQALNKAKTDYVIIGGFAIIHWGFTRATADIDLLVREEAANIKKIKKALSYLEDNAAKEIKLDDVANYDVIRIADEIIIDLLGKACGKTFDDLKKFITVETIEGVAIPFLSPEGLLHTKQSIRPKDIQDKNFLKALLGKKRSPNSE